VLFNYKQRKNLGSFVSNVFMPAVNTINARQLNSFQGTSPSDSMIPLNQLETR
jgi:hypothetical protein